MTNPKTFLVTGANKGIGYEIARQLAAGGARVFVSVREAPAKLMGEFLRDRKSIPW